MGSNPKWKCTVLVVGAGPAGLTAGAITLARYGVPFLGGGAPRSTPRRRCLEATDAPACEGHGAGALVGAHGRGARRCGRCRVAVVGLPPPWRRPPPRTRDSASASRRRSSQRACSARPRPVACRRTISRRCCAEHVRTLPEVEVRTGAARPSSVSPPAVSGSGSSGPSSVRVVGTSTRGYVIAADGAHTSTRRGARHRIGEHRLVVRGDHLRRPDAALGPRRPAPSPPLRDHGSAGRGHGPARRHRRPVGLRP